MRPLTRKLGLLYSYQTIDDLQGHEQRPQKSAVQHNLRSKIKIGIIDDKPFDPARNLRNFGYDISEIGDVKNLSEVEKYAIILCDLMGVGLNFDSDLQGATLVREIRRNYPAIMIGAYSGASSSSKNVQRSKIYADKFIVKDADNEEWTDHLDELICEALDTKNVWFRIRSSLVEQKIGTKLLLQIEDEYVRSIRYKKANLDSIHNIISSKNTSDSVRGILTGLASSAIFKLIVGV